MQFIVLLFGAFGFSLVMVTGFTAGRQPDLVLRDAALGCLASAFVGRWFAGVLDQAFAQTLAASRARQEAEAEKKEAPRAPAVPVPAPAAGRPRSGPAVPATPASPLTAALESRQVNKTKITSP